MQIKLNILATLAILAIFNISGMTIINNTDIELLMSKTLINDRLANAMHLNPKEIKKWDESQEAPDLFIKRKEGKRKWPLCNIKIDGKELSKEITISYNEEMLIITNEYGKILGHVHIGSKVKSYKPRAAQIDESWADDEFSMCSPADSEDTESFELLKPEEYLYPLAASSDK